jgi:uncharacterized protein
MLTIPQVAEALGVLPTRVNQHLRDGELVAVKNDEGKRSVPALLVQDGAIVKSLPAVITLLRDARFSDEDIVEWLYRVDDSLPGSPIDALRANRGSEIKRRAQVAGY